MTDATRTTTTTDAGVDLDDAGGLGPGVSDPEATRSRPPAGSKHGLLSRLYHGETRADIVGRWKRWLLLSGVVILVGALSLGIKGLNLGIDFTGGTVWKVPAGRATVTEISDAMAELGYEDVQVQEVSQSGSGSGRAFNVEAEATAGPAARTTDALAGADRDLRTVADDVPAGARGTVEDVRSQLDGIDGPFRQAVPPALSDLRSQAKAIPDDVAKVKEAKRAASARSAVRKLQPLVDQLSDQETAERQRVGRAVSTELADLTGTPVSQVAVDTVGPSWGKQISEKARNALIVFLIAITLYITLRFEFRMALATLAALVHDLLIVIGVYALFGFPVTPATVIAILTILGFSIYDGIVVFDRVDENTPLVGKRSKMTYSEMANLSLNQVLMRSLNTSITALLPILSVLVIGAVVLGATTLQEFGLALFIGLLSGAYSSIFIATPLLAVLKEREPRYRQVRERLAAGLVTSGGPSAAGATASATTASTDAPSGDRGAVAMRPQVVVSAGAPPRPRKQGRKR